MNIEEMIFDEAMMPTVEQVRAVWESIPYAPSSQKVVDWFARKQIEISKRAVCYYAASGWAPVKARKRYKRGKNPAKNSGHRSGKKAGNPAKASIGLVKGVQPGKFYPPTLVVTEVHETPKAAPPPDPKPQPQQAAPEPKPEPKPEVALDPRGVLGKLTPEQMNALLARIDGMLATSVADLTAMLKKRWLVMNILLAEYGALTSSQIACSPKDTAAFMSSSTEAVQQVVAVPDIAAVAAPDHAANGNGVHAPNEQASSISIFRRQQGLM